LLPGPARISGQRRYPESAIALVGVILLVHGVRFSLAEQKALMTSRGVAPDEWQRLARRKLPEFDDQMAKARAAREAIDRALLCPQRGRPALHQLPQPRHRPPPLHEAHSH
jgi:MerR family copper efflux transcriptional regulator